MLATVVDTSALWQTIVAALGAGVGTTFVFSIAILGAARFSDASREGRTGEAILFGAVGILGLLATLAGVVAAVIVMTTK
jgi:hypothetical protein